MHNLHELPKLRDSLSYLYVERCIIEQKAKAVETIDENGRTMIPAANLTVLLLGPGTSITHAAIKSLADNGCGIVWVGEDTTRFYAHGSGETRRAYHVLHQARLASNPKLRLEVCKRMYRKRFDDELDPTLSIQQLRGKEGARVRTAYTTASIKYGVPWSGRNYKRGNWNKTDPVNRALSTANALLYGVCHSAIVSGGYSPALGFVHTGKQRSFVYDIADLYKVEITIPVAFRAASESPSNLYQSVRQACREAFKEHRLLEQILPDIDEILAVPKEVIKAGEEADTDPARPEPLWTPSLEETPSQEVAEPTRSIVVDRGEKESEAEPATAVEAAAAAVEDDAEPAALRLRRERAEAGLGGGWIITPTSPQTWNVITNSGPPGYTIQRQGRKLQCDCPDFVKTELGVCKHTIAVELVENKKET